MLDRDTLWNEYVVLKKSCETIGKEHGYSGSTIRNHLKKNGIDLRPAGMTHPVPERDELIRVFAESNYSIAQTAKHFGCTGCTAAKWFRSYDIDTLPPHSKLDMTGFAIGSLTVVGEALNRKAHQSTWIVVCSNCDYSAEIPGWKLRKQRKSGCPQCETHATFTGVGELSGQYWSKVKYGALQRGIEFSIEKNYAWRIFLSQEGRCALSGVELHLCRHYTRRHDQTASLDRKDSTKGYVDDNVQWVHKSVNRLKGIFTDEELIYWCIQIVNHRKDVSV